MNVTFDPRPRRALRAALPLAATFLGAALGIASAEGGTPEDVRARLLEGVEGLERVGVPGAIAVLGPEAFAVVVGAAERDLAVVAAAQASSEAGSGRVVAFAHDGYLAPDAAARPGAERLVQNALRWAAGDEPREPAALRVGILGRDAGLEAALVARGYAVEPATPPFSSDVLIWRGGGDLTADELAALERRLAAGGGLVCAVCPWGWAQTHPGLALPTRLHPNRVLGPRGLAFADGTASPGADDSFAVRTAPREDDASAWGALVRVRDGLAPVRVEAIEHALRSAPPEALEFDALVRAVLGDAFDPESAPRPERPLKASDVRARLAATRAVLEWRAAARAVEPSAGGAAGGAAGGSAGGSAGAPTGSFPIAPGADAFPGAVPTDAPRAACAVELDASPPGWRSTGLYLPPGGVLSVQAEKGSRGWRLRVGAHRDALWHRDAWSRWPEITDEIALGSEVAFLASAFGGPVYLVAPEDVGGGGAEGILAVVTGCVSAPLYDLANPRAKEEWAWRRDAPAPWAELVGHHLAMTVPSRSVRALDDPGALLAFWDAVVAAHCELGAEPLPARPERFVADVQISAGYMHSGYPVMTYLDVVEPGALQLDLARLEREGSWGHFHELGHNRQKGAWTFGGTGEVTCNLFTLHAAEKLCGIVPWEHPWLAGQKEAARAYLAAPDFDAVWCNQPGVALVTYAELQREFGWAPFTAAFAAYQGAPEPRGNAAKIEAWIRRISLACARDLRPFFRRWGWPIGPALNADADLAALPAWSGDVASW